MIAALLLAGALKIAPDIPPAVRCVVPVVAVSPVGYTWGFGTPVLPNVLVTIGHVADAPGLLAWRDQDGQTHGLYQILRGEGDSPAWYRSDGFPFPCTVEVSRRVPAIGERLYWRLYLDSDKRTPSIVSGAFMGIDSEGDWHVDGVAHPGSSGSGVLQADGRMVGVLRATYNPIQMANSGTISEAIGILRARTFCRANMAFVPLKFIPALPGVSR